MGTVSVWDDKKVLKVDGVMVVQLANIFNTT